MSSPPSRDATAPPRRMISRGLRRLGLHNPNKVAQEVTPLALESNVVPLRRTLSERSCWAYVFGESPPVVE